MSILQLKTSEQEVSFKQTMTRYVSDAQLSRMLAVKTSEAALSDYDFAVVLLAALAGEMIAELIRHVPILLNAATLGMDATNSTVVQHCKLLIVNTVHALVLGTGKATEDQEADATRVVEFLTERDVAWAAEDVGPAAMAIGSADRVSAFVGMVVTGLWLDEVMVGDWRNEALKWAVRCPTPHTAARAFQVYRALGPLWVPESVDVILRRLHTCLRLA